MSSFKVHPSFAVTSVKYSPWEPSSLAIAGAENFGVVGKGAVYLLHQQPAALTRASSMQCACICPLSDACFDVAYVECMRDTLLAATGDGIQVLQKSQFNGNYISPIAHRSEHRGEVVAVQCNYHSKNIYASASNDRTFKIWDIERENSISTCIAHTKELYEASWSPHSPYQLGTCSGDGTLRLWDTRQLQQSAHARSDITWNARSGILSLDWNKYTNLIAASSVDKTVRLYDLRKIDREICTLNGHEAAVRKVRWSPHSKTALLSGGYDFSCNLWDIANLADGKGAQNPLVQRYHHHTEFVIGLDWNLFQPNSVASCGFDGYVYTWMLGSQPARGSSMLPPFPSQFSSQRRTPPQQGKGVASVL